MCVASLKNRRLKRRRKRRFVIAWAICLFLARTGAQSQSNSTEGKTPATTAAAPEKPATPEFFDEPQFVVAGVTDAMGPGGHGSDRVLRATEALTKEIGSLDSRSAVADATALANREQSLREELRLEPDNAEKNFQLGDVLVKLGRKEEALPYLQKARSGVEKRLAAKDDAPLHHLLAQADEQMGDALAAEHEYERASQLDPSESNVFDWGVELLEHRAAEPAIEIFEQGSHRYPHSMRMWIGLGVAWDARGSYAQAARSLCQASDLDPRAEAPYLFLGRMEQAEAGASDCALDRLKRFAQLDPTNAAGKYYYAVSLWKSRHNDNDAETAAKVESLLRDAIRLEAKFALAYLQLGTVYSHRGDLSRAEAAYGKAIERAPALAEAHYRLAQVYRKTGDEAKARSELEQYEKLSRQEAGQEEAQRKKIQQFVYTLRGQPPAPGK
jgi:tetratricopeptide (TPR) repeat protein